jgi:serine/threonine-protein kinase
MKSYAAPLALLAVLYIAFFDFTGTIESQLPERMASHFKAGGEVDGWMSRAAYHAFIVKLGLGFPLAMPVVMCLVFSVLPDSMINLPNREYWLAPERRATTRARLIQPSLWFACLSLGFVMGVHYSTIEANRHNPPHLSGAILGGLLACFLLGTTIVLLGMIIPFMQRPEK